MVSFELSKSPSSFICCQNKVAELHALQQGAADFFSQNFIETDVEILSFTMFQGGKGVDHVNFVNVFFAERLSNYLSKRSWD